MGLNDPFLPESERGPKFKERNTCGNCEFLIHIDDRDLYFHKDRMELILWHSKDSGNMSYLSEDDKISKDKYLSKALECAKERKLCK